MSKFRDNLPTVRDLAESCLFASVLSLIGFGVVVIMWLLGLL